ncbi:MAG TPA: tetratricopeptide repeat protein [Terracidiphilus sp.]|nr:tetratricopeptide repeat protein [Terracidiphilus sp.]
MTEATRKPLRQWTQKQAVLLSLACLAAGIGGGLLIPGWQKSGNVAARTAIATPAASTPAPPANTGDPAQLKTMADSQAAPLIEQLKTQPNNAELLTSVGNLYYDAKQYPIAVDYYGRALKLKPSDISVRTDMGTGLWYMGDADQAIEEFNLALSYAPNNPNTLFNRGLVKWQGRKDAAGALADWQQLLAADPDYEAKAQVQQMIAEVKAQTAVKH